MLPLGLTLLSGMILVGCAPEFPAVTAPEARAPADQTVEVTAEAGLPVTADATLDVIKVAQTMDFGSRPNPFGLLAREVNFDRSQMAARLLNDGGGFITEYEEPDFTTAEPIPVRIPVPNWRLAGVLVGESVVALLDTGVQVIEIRPGTRIDGTNWIVIAIDEETATLRNTEDVLPKEITINLQSQLFGLPGAGAPAGGPPGGPGNEFGPGGPGGQGPEMGEER
ncbi:MAG: hypothetical protein MH204_09615 [Fimbriimonadaceae bacterium]|nr:hypothetical protein [Fimbriimonadaceae bacterium]